MIYIFKFFIAFILVLLFYKLIEFKNLKKITKKDLPTELKLFLKLHNVNIKKESYEKIMKKIVFILGIDAGIVVLVTEISSSYILKILIALPCVFIVLLGSFKILGFYYKKKGMIKNES